MSDAQDDPILHEVRQNRQRLFEKHGGTVAAFMREMRRRDAVRGQSVDRSQPPKRRGDASSESSDGAASQSFGATSPVAGELERSAAS